MLMTRKVTKFGIVFLDSMILHTYEPDNMTMIQLSNTPLKNRLSENLIIAIVYLAIIFSPCFGFLFPTSDRI